MIEQAVKNWEERKEQIRQSLAEKHPENYKELVKTVISVISDDSYDGFDADPDRIHEIDDGHYQGTLVYVIAEKGYQPSDYYYVKVYYGSCSGCDTLQAICSYDDDPPKPEQIDQYMQLALNIVQGLKKMGEDTV